MEEVNVTLEEGNRLSRKRKIFWSIVIALVAILAAGVLIFGDSGARWLHGKFAGAHASATASASAAVASKPVPVENSEACLHSYATCRDTVRQTQTNVQLANHAATQCRAGVELPTLTDEQLKAIVALAETPAHCKAGLKTCESLRSAAVRVFGTAVNNMTGACNQN